MSDEQYSISIEVDASLYQQSIKKIDAITHATVNNIDESIKKVVKTLGGNIGADKFAAELEKIATKSKVLKQAG
jgi:hypothetical protein